MKRGLLRVDVILLIVASLATAYFMQRTGLLTDELVHFDQIVMFASGNYAHDPRLTTIPGYHLVMAQLVRVVHSESITFLRGTNLVLGAGCIVLFSWCHRVLESGGSGERIAQFAVFPIIFPYFFVIYTDIPSLFVVLAGLWLCLRERYALGCLALALSLGVRQNNIIWVLAIPLLCWLRQTHFDLSWRNLLGFARRCWPLGPVLIAAAGFVAWNHGVAIGDRGAHPLFRFSSGNVFFLLFVYTLLLLPLVLTRTMDNLRHARAQPHAALIWTGFLALYFFTFDNSHPYNNILPDYFLRNAVLTTVAGSLWMKIAFLIPVLLAALDLARAMRERKAIVVIVIASVLAVLPSWLIEQRYYIVSFALLLLFLPESTRRAERLTTLQCAVLSGIFMWGIQQRLFFL